MNLIPDLEQIPDKGPRFGARRWGIFCVVQLGVKMEVEEGSLTLLTPDNHQEEG